MSWYDYMGPTYRRDPCIDGKRTVGPEKVLQTGENAPDKELEPHPRRHRLVRSSGHIHSIERKRWLPCQSIRVRKPGLDRLYGRIRTIEVIRNPNVALQLLRDFVRNELAVLVRQAKHVRQEENSAFGLRGTVAGRREIRSCEV